jgi:hypothetical protein
MRPLQHSCRSIPTLFGELLRYFSPLLPVPWSATRALSPLIAVHFFTLIEYGASSPRGVCISCTLARALQHRRAMGLHQVYIDRYTVVTELIPGLQESHLKKY